MAEEPKSHETTSSEEQRGPANDMALVVALLGGGPADETPGIERLDRRPGEADPLLTGRATELMTRLGSRRSGGKRLPRFQRSRGDPALSARSRPAVASIIDTGVNAVTHSERPDQDDERNDQECSQRCTSS